MGRSSGLNSISLIAIFFLSALFSIKTGYLIGENLCWKYYNKDRPEISETSFLKISEEQREEIKREAGSEAALLLNKLMEGDASLKEMKETQKMAEDLADTFIDIGQGFEVFSIIKEPPKYVSVLSGLTSIIISFYLSIFALTLLRNLAIKKFRRSNNYVDFAVNLECIGPIEYITKTFLITKNILNTIKKK